jgi:hypothetical protein
VLINSNVSSPKFLCLLDNNRYNTVYAYGQSKLANILHANELARRLKVLKAHKPSIINPDMEAIVSDQCIIPLLRIYYYYYLFIYFIFMFSSIASNMLVPELTDKEMLMQATHYSCLLSVK